MANVIIDVDGPFGAVIVKAETRAGVKGVMFVQGTSYVWMDPAAFEEAIDAADYLIEHEPQLGKLFRSVVDE